MGAPPRQRLRPWLCSPAIAVSPAPTFTLHELSRILPAACAVGDETAHGFGGYAGRLLNVWTFVVRRRLPAVKADGCDAGACQPVRSNPVKCQPARLARLPRCRAGVNRKRLNIIRALPKAGQSLRRASLGGLPLRALRVRVMVGYVLRPSPDKSYSGAAIAALGYSGAARWVVWVASAPEGALRCRRCRWSDGGKSRRWRDGEQKGPRQKMRVEMRVGSKNGFSLSPARPWEARHSKNTCGYDPCGARKKALIQAVERFRA